MNVRKKQIIDAAYSLFIEKGYAAASIQDILERASVSKGTFYNYFSSKAECLRAILESTSEEIQTKRAAAASGKAADDSEVLAVQIAIRMRLNRERNLFALYESIFYSEDAELKAFAKSQHLREVTWLSGRIPEVYGTEAEPYALESATLVLGMTQHIYHLNTYSSSSEIPPEELTRFILRRMEASLKDQIRTKDSFLPFSLPDIQHPAIRTRYNLASKLRISADSKDKRSAEFIRFIADELESESPRLHIIKGVLKEMDNETLSTEIMRTLLIDSKEKTDQ